MGVRNMVFFNSEGRSLGIVQIICAIANYPYQRLRNDAIDAVAKWIDLGGRIPVKLLAHTWEHTMPGSLLRDN